MVLSYAYTQTNLAHEYCEVWAQNILQPLVKSIPLSQASLTALEHSFSEGLRLCLPLPSPTLALWSRMTQLEQQGAHCADLQPAPPPPRGEWGRNGVEVGLSLLRRSGQHT